MNGYGTIQGNELYKRVEDALIYPCPYSADFRVKKWRADLYTDIKRVFDVLEQYLPLIYDSVNNVDNGVRGYYTNYIIDEILLFYKRLGRRCNLKPNYWSAVQEYADYNRLKDALNHNSPKDKPADRFDPVISIDTDSGSLRVRKIVIEWYDSTNTQQTHTEKNPKKNPNPFFIGPERASEWPGVGNKRQYTKETPGYRTVIDSLLCAVEGKLGAMRFNTPIPPSAHTENENGVADKVRPFYLYLKKYVPGISTNTAIELILDLIGVPEEIKDKTSFRDRISAPRKAK